MPVLLNIFVEAYNTVVRDLPNFWRMLIAAVALVITLYCFYKIVKTSNDKQPINWRYVILMLVFCGITILYSLA